MTMPSTPSPSILALDLGISSLKAGIFDLSGHCSALVNQEILTIPEGQSLIEFDGQDYWLAAIAAIREVIRQVEGGAQSVAALSLSSHGETLFCLDADGGMTRPAILTLDDRAKEEAASLVQEFGTAKVYQITGQPDVLPIWPAVKIAWIKKHEPEIYQRTTHFLLPQGYLLYRLCGQFVDDPSVSTTTLLLDMRQRAWSPDLLRWLDISPDKLARVTASGSLLGKISAEASALTGLPADTSIVAGALDQVCSAIAAGNLQPGILCESTGSVLAITATAREPVWNGLPIYPHALPDLFCLLPWHSTGGLVLKWFRDRFTTSDIFPEGSMPDFSNLVEEAARIPPGADGMVMLPHLEGAQFPESVPGARGVFYGFGLQHGRAHFVRAILEAIAFMIRRDIEALQQEGLVIQEVISLGGGAKSELWLQIKADVCETPFITLETEQSALLGAAVLAATGAGFYTELADAVSMMSSQGKRFDPRPEQHIAYQPAFDLYLELHRRLLDLTG